MAESQPEQDKSGVTEEVGAIIDLLDGRQVVVVRPSRGWFTSRPVERQGGSVRAVFWDNDRKGYRYAEGSDA
jgi:hypothetical protein